jgi:Type I restriction modification DNA specificity domain
MSEIPATWEWSTIGNVTQYIQRGKSPKYAEQSVLPVINQKCIRWNELQLQHLKYIHPDQIDAWDEPRYIKPGDILWNSTGTGTVGRAYLVKSADTVLPKVVDSHVTIVRVAIDLEPRYLFNWIKSPVVQNKIEEMCDGTTNQIELSKTAIAATEIPIAPRAEQTRIADQLDTLLARVNACNDHLDAIPGILKRFRLAVLGAACSGALTEQWRTEQGAMSSASELCEALEADHAAFGGHERGNASEPTQEAHDLTVKQLPQGWAIATLRECCAPGRPITYGILKPGPELDVGVPYIRVADFPGNKLNLSSIKKTSPEVDLQYKRARLAGGEPRTPQQLRQRDEATKAVIEQLLQKK